MQEIKFIQKTKRKKKKKGIPLNFYISSCSATVNRLYNLIKLNDVNEI